MKRGFTLVELSIVLVIIGLLIGGIIAAQSMIRTARIQSFIRQMGQYDAAVENFQTKYNGLPGDSTKTGCVASGTAVCDNNLIEAGSAPGYPFTGELAHFWSDLSATGLINEGGTNFSSSVSATYPVIGVNIPTSKINSKAGVLAFSDSGKNYYSIISPGTSPLHGVIPMDGYAVDLKIDDGNNTTGNVTISGTLIGYFAIAFLSPDSCVSGASFTLNLANTNDACIMQIRMGNSTGNLK